MKAAGITSISLLILAFSQYGCKTAPAAGDGSELASVSETVTVKGPMTYYTFTGGAGLLGRNDILPVVQSAQQEAFIEVHGVCTNGTGIAQLVGSLPANFTNRFVTFDFEDSVLQTLQEIIGISKSGLGSQNVNFSNRVSFWVSGQEVARSEDIGLYDIMMHRKADNSEIAYITEVVATSSHAQEINGSFRHNGGSLILCNRQANVWRLVEISYVKKDGTANKLSLLPLR